jgi:regulator of extracellular matrix RemA (YlzA/DUF370 family)
MADGEWIPARMRERMKQGARLAGVRAGLLAAEKAAAERIAAAAQIAGRVATPGEILHAIRVLDAEEVALRAIDPESVGGE